jgi:hypothetical protein
MSLDLSKLENVRKDGQKTIARCPACAEKGQDHSGDHLVIYPDGRYGCVSNPKEHEHNKAIYRLAGDGKYAGRGPIPVEIKVPAGKPRTVRTLSLNSLAYKGVGRGKENNKRTGATPSEPSEPLVNPFLRDQILFFMGDSALIQQFIAREEVFWGDEPDDDLPEIEPEEPEVWNGNLPRQRGSQ